MAKKNQPADLPPATRDIRSTQPVPSAPPPEANKAPNAPTTEAAQGGSVAPPQAAGKVQQADVKVGANARTEVDQGMSTPTPDGNTPPPEGLPTPAPVIDKITVTKQARTYIDDSAIVANHRIAPADSAMIDQIISQKFDTGTTNPEDLAFDVSEEQGLNPDWQEESGVKSLKISP